MKAPLRLLALIAACTVSAASSLPQTVQKLTLQEAEQTAIQNHPRIQAAMNLASAAKAQVTQARSAYYPTVYGSLTGVDAADNSRIAAGALNNPIIYDRYANGVTVSQLVTDFGRTHELVKSSNLHAQAQQETVVTTRADVLLQVDAVVLRRAESASRTRGGARDGQGAPTCFRPSYRVGEKQNQIGPGR